MEFDVSRVAATETTVTLNEMIRDGRCRASGFLSVSLYVRHILNTGAEIPPSINLVLKHPHRHASGWDFWLILNSVKLIIKTNHHRKDLFGVMVLEGKVP